MKKILALILVVVLCLAMGTMAFADDDAPAEVDPSANPSDGAATTAPTGSIEITSPKTDPNAETTTYEAYKIFDMTTNGVVDNDGNYTAVAYTINSAWADFFATDAPGAGYIVATDTDPASLTPIVVNGSTKFINITDNNVAEFAKVAFEYAQTKPVAATTSKDVDKGATTVKFEDLDLGYYMIYPKGASVQIEPSIVSITNTAPNGSIEQKAEYPSMTKVADDISTEVGQTVTYTLSSNVPDTTGFSVYEFTFKDKTSAGLTYDGNSSVTVTIGNDTLIAGTDYTFAASPADGNDFELTINLLKAKAGTSPVEYEAKYTYNDSITITYTATVNDAAVTKIDNNHATLTYNNDPKDSSKKDTTPPVEVKTYSSKVIIEKVDGADNTKKLANAKFVLRVKTLGSATGDSHEADIAVGKYYKYTPGENGAAGSVSWVTVASEDAADLAADTTITVVTTDENGAANFDGLEDGTYELIEVEAPAGYNLLTSPAEITIAGSDSDETTLTVTAEVENNSGAQLPSTGGIGTTIFYIVGGILVLGAGVVLLSRKRASSEG